MNALSTLPRLPQGFQTIAGVLQIPAKLHALSWNERALTWEDFLRFVAQEGIVLTEQRIPGDDGRYFIYQGKPHITLAPHLWGINRLLTAFHELGHYLLHDPRHIGPEDVEQAEIEADIISICAVIPRQQVETFTRQRAVEPFYSSRYLLRLRQGLVEHYGL